MRLDIDGLMNGVNTVHRIGQDEANTGGRIEELQSGYAAFIELTESLRPVLSSVMERYRLSLRPDTIPKA